MGEVMWFHILWKFLDEWCDIFPERRLEIAIPKLSSSMPFMSLHQMMSTLIF